MIEPGTQAFLLGIVSKGRGRLSSRAVDIRFRHFHEPTGASVLQMLKGLESRQLVVGAMQPGVPIDSWGITPSGLDWLARNDREVRKTAYWQQFREGMWRVEADSVASAAERADLALYEGTLMDGLQDEEPYPYPGNRSR
jgi:hypothetical protein